MPPKKNVPRNDTQDRVLNYIKEEVRRRGFPPSVREICKALDIRSTSTVHGHLRRLENRGLLIRDSTKPRAIQVVGMNQDTTEIPVVGRVSAGSPITAVENVEDTIRVSAGLFGQEDSCFALTIRGESMINLGILDGDMVIVRQQQQAENGDIVIALVDNEEATCKRYYKEGGRFRLQPENDAMEPMFFDQVEILGKVVGLVRRF